MPARPGDRTILALDPAGITGWAQDAPDGADKPLGGVWDVTAKTYGGLGRALLAFERRLEERFLVQPFELVVYEAPIPVGGRVRIQTTQETIRGLHARGGLIEKFAAEAGIEVYEVAAPTARRYFTGMGQAGKAEVWDRAKMLGWIEPGYTLDTSDAIAILAYARGALGEQHILGQRLS